MTAHEEIRKQIRPGIVGILGLGGLGGVISTGLLGPFRLQFAEHYGLTQTQIGVAIGVTGAALGLLGVWQGPKLAQRLGRYGLLKVAVGVLTVGFAGCAFAEKPLVLLAAWGLVTLGGYLSVIANAVATDIWQDEPRRGVLLLHGSVSTGKIIGPILAAYGPLAVALLLSNDRYPWQDTFLFTAAAALTIFILLVSVKQSQLPRAPEDTAGAAPPQSVRMSAIWFSAALLGLIAGSENAVASVAPAFYHGVRDMNESAAYQLVSLHFAMLAVGRFTFGIFSRKLTLRWMMAIGFLPAFLVLPAALSANVFVFVPAFVLLGLCFSITWPAIFVHLANLLPRHRARLTLTVGLANALAIPVCILVSSRMLDIHPQSALLFGPALLVACAAAFFASIRKG